jgi:pimeloyl-ACP methyl ester carboxylesterase
MAARRPNTDLHEIRGAHVVHMDNPQGFTGVVRAVLEPFVERPTATP